MTGNGLPDGTPQATDAPAADGVTHFKLEFARASPPAWGQVAELCEWRDRLHALGLVGQTPLRYGGVGFGNLSARHPHRPGAFVITGTQTGARTQLGPHDFAIVTQVDIGANTVRAHGGTAPSSEAMTHAQCYAADPRIAFVFHGHAPQLWHAADALGLTATPADVAYGTPAMAAAVAALLAHGLAESPVHETGAALDAGGATLAGAPALSMLLKMGGHEDGIIAVGSSAYAAGHALLRALARLGAQLD